MRRPVAESRAPSDRALQVPVHGAGDRLGLRVEYVRPTIGTRDVQLLDHRCDGWIHLRIGIEKIHRLTNVRLVLRTLGPLVDLGPRRRLRRAPRSRQQRYRKHGHQKEERDEPRNGAAAP